MVEQLSRHAKGECALLNIGQVACAIDCTILGNSLAGPCWCTAAEKNFRQKAVQAARGLTRWTAAPL